MNFQQDFWHPYWLLIFLREQLFLWDRMLRVLLREELLKPASELTVFHSLIHVHCKLEVLVESAVGRNFRSNFHPLNTDFIVYHFFCAVSVISSDSRGKNINVRFTTVAMKSWFDQKSVWLDKCYSVNFSIVSHKKKCANHCCREPTNENKQFK